MITLTTRIVLGLASFGLAGLLGASPAHAGHGRAKGPEAQAERLCAELACSPAQRAKIVEIKAASRTPEARSARDNLRSLKEQVRAEKEKPRPDAQEIARLKGLIAAQKATVASQRQATQQQVMAVLSPSQKATYQARIEARAKRHEGKGKGRGKGKGKGKGHGKGKQRHEG